VTFRARTPSSRRPSKFAPPGPCRWLCRANARNPVYGASLDVPVDGCDGIEPGSESSTTGPGDGPNSPASRTPPFVDAGRIRRETVFEVRPLTRPDRSRVRPCSVDLIRAPVARHCRRPGWPWRPCESGAGWWRAPWKPRPCSSGALLHVPPWVWNDEASPRPRAICEMPRACRQLPGTDRGGPCVILPSRRCSAALCAPGGEVSARRIWRTSPHAPGETRTPQAFHIPYFGSTIPPRRTHRGPTAIVLVGDRLAACETVDAAPPIASSKLSKAEPFASACGLCPRSVAGRTGSKSY